MTDLVIVALGAQCLALTQDQFREALERGRELIEGITATPSGANGDAPEHLLTAEGMEALTQVPASWFLEQARRGELPHHKLGKYVRFRFDEVLACSRFRERVR